MAQTIPQTVADFETSLSAQTLAGDTTFTLSSVEDADGNTIPSGLYAMILAYYRVSNYLKGLQVCT